ncbi:phage holin [Priestia megaterium]
MFSFILSDRATLIRVIVFVLAWFNQYLTANGLQPLPVLSEEAVSSVITLIVSVWTLGTNNKPKQAKTLNHNL